MKQEGHIGVSLLFSSPIVGILVYLQEYILAGIFLAIILWSASIPDIDIKLQQYLPIKHRGFTHTFHFAIVFGILQIALGVLILEITNNTELLRTELIVILFISGFLGITFHTLGDIVTMSGVKYIPDYTLFKLFGIGSWIPLVETKFAFKWFRFDNLVANIGFLLIGSIATILAFATGAEGTIQSRYFIAYLFTITVLTGMIILIGKNTSWQFKRNFKSIRNITTLKYWFRLFK